jgi:hypothetical protein
MPSTLALEKCGFELGQAQHSFAMSLIPILKRNHSPRCYLSAEEALLQRGLEISEVSAAGSVPTLNAHNALLFDVLIVDGEELIGAKQNRVLNTSVLIPAGSTLGLPVSCVEQGRWQHDSPSMDLSGNLDTLHVRQCKVASVSDSVRATGTYGSDQYEVWDRVNEVIEEVEADSHTSAMRDAYATRSADLVRYEGAFAPEPDQVGAVIAINGRWTGIELFAHADVYASHASKIIRSHAMSIDASLEDVSSQTSREDAQAAFKDLGSAKADRFPAVGSGTNVRFEHEHWQGAALELEDQLIHLVAFAADAGR